MEPHKDRGEHVPPAPPAAPAASAGRTPAPPGRCCTQPPPPCLGPMAQQYLTGPAQIVPPLAGAGLALSTGQSPQRRRTQPPADNGFPRASSQIRQETTQKSCPSGTPAPQRRKCRSDPRHHCCLYLRVVPGQLRRGRHAVDPRVSLHTRAVVRPLRALSSAQRQRSNSWVMGVVNTSFSGYRGRYKIHIHPIAAQHMGLIQGAARLGGEAAVSPGPALHIHFTAFRPSPIQGNRPQGYRHSDAVSCVFSRQIAPPAARAALRSIYIVRPGDAPDKLGGSESPLHCHELKKKLSRIGR